MTSGTRVVGYVRVSTDRQGESGLGLQAQREAIERECAHRGWELAAIHEDVASGGSTSRPGLDAAILACLDGNAAGIVVAKLDRLSRSVIHFANLLEAATKDGWNIVALDFGLDLATPQGRLVANVLMSVAVWEREMIGLRTREALAQARANGVVLGRPSGVSDELRARITQMRSSGMTYQNIADVLNLAEVPTAQNGAEWYSSTIAAILRADRVPV